MMVFLQGWRQEISDRGLTLPTRGLNYGFQGIVNAKNLRQNSFSPSDGELECSDRGAIAPSGPPLVPPLFSYKKRALKWKNWPLALQLLLPGCNVVSC